VIHRPEACTCRTIPASHAAPEERVECAPCQAAHTCPGCGEDSSDDPDAEGGEHYVCQTQRREEKALREADERRLELREENLPPAEVCPRCHLAVSPDPDDDRHAECGWQQIDEDCLDTRVDLAADELAEAFEEYLGDRRRHLESPATTEQVAVLRHALALIRSTLDLARGPFLDSAGAGHERKANPSGT
jgi:hypothetical protein